MDKVLPFLELWNTLNRRGPWQKAASHVAIRKKEIIHGPLSPLVKTPGQHYLGYAGALPVVWLRPRCRGSSSWRSTLSAHQAYPVPGREEFTTHNSLQCTFAIRHGAARECRWPLDACTNTHTQHTHKRRVGLLFIQHTPTTWRMWLVICIGKCDCYNKPSAVELQFIRLMWCFALFLALVGLVVMNTQTNT